MTEEIFSINSRTNQDFIPGTINIYSFHAEHDATKLKLTKDNVILQPQPTDSVNDPLNWTRSKKLWNFALLAFITGFTAATSNDAGSTQDSLNEIYGISYDAMNTGAGVLFAAIGWTTFLFTPMANLYGRKITYFVCIFVGLVGAVWFSQSRRTSDTIWSQMFVGASEACAEAHVQQSLTDMYFSHQIGSVLTVYMLATSVGTYLGPLIGGFIDQYCGFRWVGWIAVFISAGLLIVIFFGMHETYFDRLVYQKTEQDALIDDSYYQQKQFDEKLLLEKQSHSRVNNSSVSSEMSQHDDAKLELAKTENNGANETKKGYWKSIALITPAVNIVGTGFKQYVKRLLMLFRVFMFPPTLYSGLIWGIQDALLTFYLTVEDDQYYDPPWSYSDTGVALMNVPCLIGSVIGCIYAGIFSDWFTIWMAKRNNGIQEAEFRLYFLALPAILCPIGLMLFAVGTDHQWPWFPTYFGLALIGFGFGSSGDVSMSYLMDAYPDMVIEMMAGVAVINNMIGCIFTFACSPWLDAMGNTKTFIILSVITFVAMLGGIPFIYYGKRIRNWTKPWYLEYCEMRDGKL
ncbi:Major Facilitator Superfamily protein [Clavispora lusitaniae]|uniref:Major facilitator superfamily (MFS) profile domain-containing protein n=1 Tax=Clavispora lusitaniae (strain ATCC 42720) TaxID=306902 RepID=C4Y8D4_CLAL4|nr:uncharacterized protein CLUG_04462 [Clavispora lusitaniae ATCC 42720]EEQ40334.1 hypothetical protein CLUG_04462 [Clavispora lusitaniae ATCC 42720]KAF5209698.1 hypothetical protein E0198_004009 [Clavispora lusitaniae]KAF7581728.1 Major Facilitator Superfamily protein [Clavispora lusitaniae]